MKPGPAEARSGARVKSLDTALSLVSEFLAHDQDFGVADLAARTGMPKGQISKILATFRDHGLLTQDPKTRRYAVGLRTFLLGSRFATQDRLTGYALPMMRELSQATGHSVRLSVMDGDTVVYLMGIEGRAFVDTGWRAGTYLPLHSTSAGRIVLAFVEEARAKRLLAAMPLDRLTAETVIDRDALREVVAEVRARGYSVQRGETNPGLATIAVPVFGEAQRIIGVIGFAFPSHTVPERDEAPLVDRLHRYARVLSLRMGGAVYPFGFNEARGPMPRVGERRRAARTTG